MAEGIASQDTTIGRIDPSTLIGRANPNIVEPRATAALTDAFRQGFITSDDIMARVGEVGRSRKKADIAVSGAQAQLAGEQVSPEAQAARAAQLSATTEQAQLAEAEALRKQVIQEYPAVAYFDKFAPAAGIEAPTLPDGTPDYKKMEKIGAELAIHQAQKSEAQQQLENITTKDSADGTVLFAITKQGESVSPQQVQALRAKATQGFRRQAAGTVEVEPREVQMPEPAPVIDPDGIQMPEPAPAIELQTSPTAAVEVMPISGVAPAGTPVASGVSLGPPKQAPASPEDATKRQAQIVAAEAITPVIENALAAVARGSVGPAAGSGPAKVGNQVAAALGLGREQQFQDQRQLEMAISNKVLEGAQVMKGNLSDKDVRFLQATVPKLSDTPQVWNEYLNRWKQMNDLNIEILAGRQPKITKDIFSVGAATPTASPAAAAAGTPVKVNSAAEALALPPTVQFFLTPDGKPKKNPNYRP